MTSGRRHSGWPAGDAVPGSPVPRGAGGRAERSVPRGNALPDVVIADRVATREEVDRLEDELVAILADVLERERTIAA